MKNGGLYGVGMFLGRCGNGHHPKDADSKQKWFLVHKELVGEHCKDVLETHY
jgi:hypothetical protein